MSQYPIDFLADPSNAIRGIDALIAKILQLDGVARAAQASLLQLGTNTGGITRAATKAGNLATALQGVGTHSVGAQSGLAGIAATNTGLGKAAGHAQSLHLSLGGMVSLATGLGLVRKVIGGIGDALKEAREHGEAMGEGNLTKKDKLRELAGIMNQPEVNDKVISGVFDVGLKSGLSFDESNEFLKGLHGSIPAGIKKGNIREGQIPEVAEEAARATVRFGLDPYVGGDFAGAITQHVDLNRQKDAQGNPMTAREAMAAQFGGGVFAANEGRGAVSSLIKQELAAAAVALSSGRLKDMSEVGGFIQAASTISKTGAFSGTKFNQLDAALNHQAGIGDKAGDFEKEIGVAAAKGDRAKLDAFKKHLDQVKPEDSEAYLAQHGFNSQTERRAIVGFAANTDVVNKGIAKTAAIIQDGAAQVAANEAFTRTQLGRDKISRTTLEKSQFKTGERHAEFTIAARNAMAQLEGQGAFDDAGIRIEEKMRGDFGFQEFLGAPDDVKRMVLRQMAKNVERTVPNARKKGLTETRFNDLPAGDKLKYMLGIFGQGGVYGESAAQRAILEHAEPTLPMNPKAAAAAVDRAVKENVEAATGRTNRGPVLQGGAPAQHRGAPGPAGGRAVAPGHAALDVGDIKSAAGALHQAAGALLTAAHAQHNTIADFGGGGYDPYRA